MGSNEFTPTLDPVRQAAHAGRIVAEASASPDVVFAGLAPRRHPVYLWGDGQGDKGRYSIVAAEPRAVLTSLAGQTELHAEGQTRRLEGSPLKELESLLAGVPDGEASLPFCGGAIGYISYEFACASLGVHRPSGPLPDVWFGLYDSAYVFDHAHGRGYWVGSRLSTSEGEPTLVKVALSQWTASVTAEEYASHVRHVLEGIATGRLYQANYTQRWTAEGEVDETALALAFRRRLPSPLGAYLGLSGGAIWSLSPERLLSGKRGQKLESRPIKGTRPRDSRPAHDRALGEDLLQHPKDRAELLMIVDLVRNDLGKVASTGAVSVPRLFGLETCYNVHHLEATVTGDFPVHRTWTDALTAILPGGSVTGAPKRSAVELLARLEPVPRSVYTGALGYLSYNGRGDFNLPIRTLYRAGRTFHLHSGGGVVSDSRPEAEYQESLLKVSHIRSLLDSL